MGNSSISRLSCLMECLGLSGRDIAQNLHVDYSLVSKWRNNSRQISVRSNHLKNLVTYLLTLDQATDYVHIRRVLTSDYEYIETASYNMLYDCLCRWLSNSPKTRTTNHKQGHHSYSANFDVYNGNQGRRHAVLRFLDKVLSMHNEQQLFLLSQEDMTWLLEDTAFLEQWGQKLAKILSAGHKIIIIHTVDRGFGHLSSILSHWLPLHLSGNIESYYYPRYTDNRHKLTLFVHENEACIIGMTPEPKGNGLYTAYFTDEGTVKHSESLFKSYLLQCLPLLSQYPMNQSDSLLETIYEAEVLPDNSFLLSGFPPIVTMSASTLLDILNENKIEKEVIQKCLDYHRSLQGFFRISAELYHIRHAYCLDTLYRAALHKEPIVYSDLSFLCQRRIEVSLTQFTYHLDNIVALMQEYSSFEVALFDTPIHNLQKSMFLWIKQNRLAMASTLNARSHAPFTVLSKENTVVEAFCLFFDNVWSGLPRNHKEKGPVIDRLRAITEIGKLI